MASFVPGALNSSFLPGKHVLDERSTCRLQRQGPYVVACTQRSAMDAESAANDDTDQSSIQAPITHPDLTLDENPPPPTPGSEDEMPSELDTESSWYSVVDPIGKPDTKGKPQTPAPSDGVLDLMELDGMGRQMLSQSSYNTVVDVDIEEGGVLDDDEDNNDLFCGVGLDALVENEQILKNLRTDFKIVTATHVQLSAIPRVLDGRDIVIQSHTGTGKTLAFLLPMLDDVDPEMDCVQGVVVAPTRELAMQIARECDRLVVDTGIRSLALIGGANPLRQVEKIRRRLPHIVVGTPGRLAELEDNRDLHLRDVRMLVVDEADQCLQDAFMEHLVYLLRAVPRRTQKVLASATGDVDSVREFAGRELHKAVLLRVGGAARLPKNIAHWYCVVPARMRIELLRKLMSTAPVPARAIAFVDDPRRVDIVVERLYAMKVSAAALRGNAHKLERAEVLTAFRKGKVPLLVTTEVAARGLDVREVTHVFNLDLPTDADHYVHRAGRCGRAGEVGTVVSIATSETAFVVGRLARELGVEIKRMEPRDGVYGEPVERTARVGARERRDAVAGRGAPRDASAERRGSRDMAAGRGAPRDMAAGRGAPRDGAVRRDAPRDMAAGRGMPRDAAVGRGTPRNMAAGRGTLRDVAVGRGTSRDAAVGRAAPRDMAAGRGEPRDAASGRAAPKEAAGRRGTTREGWRGEQAGGARRDERRGADVRTDDGRARGDGRGTNVDVRGEDEDGFTTASVDARTVHAEPRVVAAVGKGRVKERRTRVKNKGKRRVGRDGGEGQRQGAEGFGGEGEGAEKRKVEDGEGEKGTEGKRKGLRQSKRKGDGSRSRDHSVRAAAGGWVGNRS